MKSNDYWEFLKNIIKDGVNGDVDKCRSSTLLLGQKLADDGKLELAAEIGAILSGSLVAKTADSQETYTYVVTFEFRQQGVVNPLKTVNVFVTSPYSVEATRPLSRERMNLEDAAWNNFYTWLEKNPVYQYHKISNAYWMLDASEKNFREVKETGVTVEEVKDE